MSLGSCDFSMLEHNWVEDTCNKSNCFDTSSLINLEYVDTLDTKSKSEMVDRLTDVIMQRYEPFAFAIKNQAIFKQKLTNILVKSNRIEGTKERPFHSKYSLSLVDCLLNLECAFNEKLISCHLKDMYTSMCAEANK